MYKLKPLVTYGAQFDHQKSTMYRLASIHYEGASNSDIETIAEKQARVIKDLEGLLRNIAKIAQRSGLPEELFAATLQYQDTLIESVPKTTLASRSSTSFHGRFELICHSSLSILFSLLALPDWIPGGDPKSNIEFIFYSHSSLMTSNARDSHRLEHAIKTLKNKLPLQHSYKTSPLSITVRLIVHDNSEFKDTTFYINDFDNKNKSQRMSRDLQGEGILLRCFARLLGFELSDQTVEEMILFSQAANDFLKENSRHSLARFDTPTATAIQTLP